MESLPGQDAIPFDPLYNEVSRSPGYVGLEYIFPLTRAYAGHFSAHDLGTYLTCDIRKHHDVEQLILDDAELVVVDYKRVPDGLKLIAPMSSGTGGVMDTMVLFGAAKQLTTGL
jgi:hypothetical protein